MTLEEAKKKLESVVNNITSEVPLNFFDFTSALVKVFMSDKSALEASDVIEKEIGEEKANQWLCEVMSKSGKYSTDGEYVEVVQ